MKNPKALVVGMGICSAVGMNPSEVWNNLSNGFRGISTVKHLETSKDILVGEINASNLELASALGISEGQYSRTFLLGFHALKQAISDCEIDFHAERVGLIYGSTVGGMDQTEKLIKQHGWTVGEPIVPIYYQHDCGAFPEMTQEILGIKFDYINTLSTACASAANAIIQGAQMLELGLLDKVIVGGADALSLFTVNGFSSLMIMEQDYCKPFSRTRAGLNLGEGAAFLVLSAESTKSYGAVSGYANRCDAYHQTATSPNGEGPFLAMEGAIKKAGLTAKSIDYINTHGTGTPNNDATEFAAMQRIFGDGQVPAFSSTKSYTGHTLAACGAIEAVISMLMLQHQQLIGNFEYYESEIEGCHPLVGLQNATIEHLLSNSNGFGGNDSSIIFSKVPEHGV
ncbi:beta-ketoacyl-[acyl-carrier-protein] synthase family protein [Persicobacter psychrovividus]|uniref:Beta-ACP synthase n=1 Tax=Persicobacter psychrovividus TaxID=387638 RepID=A0ABN6LKJ7_9BACT|nr:beta-ACP synthase [Persicobacter psychrovividus]